MPRKLNKGLRPQECGTCPPGQGKVGGVCAQMHFCESGPITIVTDISKNTEVGSVEPPTAIDEPVVPTVGPAVSHTNFAPAGNV